jgi:hypothetical protein
MDKARYDMAEVERNTEQVVTEVEEAEEKEKQADEYAEQEIDQALD